jgi:hypothetical protein
MEVDDSHRKGMEGRRLEKSTSHAVADGLFCTSSGEGGGGQLAGRRCFLAPNDVNELLSRLC